MRTLASHRGYYERWAKTWEFQALLKARPVAGDLELGRRVRRDGRADGLAGGRARRASSRTCRRCAAGWSTTSRPTRPSGSSSSAPAGCATSSSPSSCSSSCTAAPTSGCAPPTTLSALAELTRGGYVGRDDGEALHEAYAFLRTLEHRIQLHQLRRTHVVPDDEEALRRLGRSLGFTKDPVVELDKVWQHHRREVRRLHEKLFYRPLLGRGRQDPGRARPGSRPRRPAARLAALGYQRPEGARCGTSRR